MPRPIGIVNCKPRSRPAVEAAPQCRLLARSDDAELLDRHWTDWRSEPEPDVIIAWLDAWHTTGEG